MCITKHEYSKYEIILTIFILPFMVIVNILVLLLVTNRSLPIIDRYFDVCPVKVYLIIIIISFTV